MEILK